MDRASMDWRGVFVSGGRRGLEVEFDPADLVALTDATLGALAKGSA